jgi:hypothetical protein
VRMKSQKAELVPVLNTVATKDASVAVLVGVEVACSFSCARQILFYCSSVFLSFSPLLLTLSQ